MKPVIYIWHLINLSQVYAKPDYWKADISPPNEEVSICLMAYRKWWGPLKSDVQQTRMKSITRNFKLNCIESGRKSEYMYCIVMYVVLYSMKSLLLNGIFLEFRHP